MLVSSVLPKCLRSTCCCFGISLMLTALVSCRPAPPAPLAPTAPQANTTVPGANVSADSVAQANSEETTESTETDREPAPSTSKREGQVLRHAVFFKFKESSSKEDVAQVVQAFGSLPAKVDTIIDFEWGTNNSPEGLNEGLTHCFLLSFRDEAGREVYLPHPDHKAFGDVLRPHMEKVFVIDYWGDAENAPLEKELRHAVFVKFKDDAAAESVAQVEQAFADLPGKIEEVKQFEWGLNNSSESHDNGFTHCFMLTFDSEEGRQAYLPHPDHKALVEVLTPVLDKVRVLDYWAQRER